MHIRDYLEHLKRKPSHERERIALGTSSAFVAVIAFGWLGAFVTSDALTSAPQGPSVSSDLAQVQEDAGDGFSQLLGAASAFKAATEGNGLVIVDGSASSTIENAPAEDTRTVIPF